MATSQWKWAEIVSDAPEGYDIDATNIRVRGRRPVSWRQDPIVLARLPEVQKRRDVGMHNTQIAAELGVSEGTVRLDRKRLLEWAREQVGGDIKARRELRIAELEAIADKAQTQAEHDARLERAVLLDEPYGTRKCPGGVSHGSDASPCQSPHLIELRVYRDHKGSAQFRSAKAQSLNVARQALVDAAKIEGIVVDKVAPTDGDGVTLPIGELMERYARAHNQ